MSKLQSELLKRAHAFSKETGYSLGRIGKILVGDNRFFGDIESGKRNCTVPVLERCMHVFESPRAWEEAVEAERKKRAA